MPGTLLSESCNFVEPVFFFFVLRRPPRSTLFPYTRSSDLQQQRGLGIAPARVRHHRAFCRTQHQCRSEEHTSELQSRFDLVCRLLPEKKNAVDYDIGLALRILIIGLAIGSAHVCTPVQRNT